MDSDDPGDSEEDPDQREGGSEETEEGGKEIETSVAQSKEEERLPMWWLHCHCGAWAFWQPCCAVDQVPAQVKVQHDSVQEKWRPEWKRELARLRKEVKRLRKEVEKKGKEGGEKAESDKGGRGALEVMVDNFGDEGGGCDEEEA